MAILFYQNSKVIFVEAPTTEITVQELINEVRSFEAQFIGIDNNVIANASGKEDLGGGNAVGITLELINDWRVQFEERVSQTFCYVRGGNLVATNIYDNNPIKPSTNVNVVLELSTSVALVEGSGSPWSEAEKDEVMSELDAIKTETDKIGRILGLSQENFRINSAVYDGDGNMTSAVIKIYASANDCENQVNPIAEYEVIATYSAGQCTDYKVKKV